MRPIYIFKVKERPSVITRDNPDCSHRVMKEKGFDTFPAIDMLCYDSGKIVGKVGNMFVVESTQLTTGRWESFSVTPEEVNPVSMKDSDWEDEYDNIKLWQAELSKEIVDKCGKENALAYGRVKATLMDYRDVEEIIRKKDLPKKKGRYTK